MTFAQITAALLAYPKKQTDTLVTDTSMPAAGVAVTPANFGLTTIDDIYFTDAEITGSVNTQTLRPKYDAATGKIFYFGQADVTSTTVAKPLAIIPGNIASAVKYNARAVGNR